VARCLAVALALTFAFLGIGFFLSSVSRTAERATVFALVVWLFVSAFHDFALIGLLLQTRIPPRIVFFLAAANPVESARIAVLSAVDPELSVLGPVGFWIANSLGPRGTLALGVLWPTALGALGLVATARRIHRADLTS
jgi:ABC-2 type transport system permease protein